MEPLPEILSRITTITFDCYGTLIDWDKGLRQSIGELFGGIPATRSQEFFELYVETEAQIENQASGADFKAYRDVLTETAIQLAEKLSIPLSKSHAEKFADMLPTWTPFADTSDALQRLKQQYKLGILSNVDRDLFQATAKQFPIKFDFIITAQDVRSYKPHHGHFDRLLAKHSELETTLHVAQSLRHDGVPARQLGLAFVWINRYNDSQSSAIPMAGEFPNLKALAGIVCE